jgi:coenzyme F420-reducing hydrogenase delta subunit
MDKKKKKHISGSEKKRNREKSDLKAAGSDPKQNKIISFFKNVNSESAVEPERPSTSEISNSEPRDISELVSSDSEERVENVASIMSRRSSTEEVLVEVPIDNCNSEEHVENVASIMSHRSSTEEVLVEVSIDNCNSEEHVENVASIVNNKKRKHTSGNEKKKKRERNERDAAGSDPKQNKIICFLKNVINESAVESESPSTSEISNSEPLEISELVSSDSEERVENVASIMSRRSSTEEVLVEVTINNGESNVLNQSEYLYLHDI